jgi:CheY-like chemotaxis protein
VSVALTRVLVIRLGDARFGMPTAAISAVIAAGAGDVAEIHQRPTLRVRDEWLPLAPLGGILGQPAPRTDAIRAIVIGDDARRIALEVSGWEGDQDVVVKPLGELLEAARLFSGACLLESGELTLVLNPAAVMAQALAADRGGGWAARWHPPEPVSRREHRILFAEDSAVTRSLILHVLVELGYQVTAARDGKEALELLRERGADLVLTDLDMPVVGGVELIRRLRSSEIWGKLPILVLSTRGSEADRRRALEAGADDYVVKGESWEATLRQALRRRLEQQHS